MLCRLGAPPVPAVPPSPPLCRCPQDLARTRDLLAKLQKEQADAEPEYRRLQRRDELKEEVRAHAHTRALERVPGTVHVLKSTRKTLRKDSVCTVHVCASGIVDEFES